MAVLKSEDIKAQASRFALVTPSLERIEAIDVRLAAIPGDVRESKRGLLPAVEIEQKLAAVIEGLRARHPHHGNPLPQVSGVGKVFFHDGGEEVLSFILWLIGPERLKQYAHEAIARERFEVGLPAKEREAVASRLATERERLVAEREKLVETVRGAGLDYVHLPETQERINQETHATLRASMEAEEARRRMAALDKGHAVEAGIDARRERGEI